MPRDTHLAPERAHHVGVSLALLGITMVFFAALLAAEHHELGALRGTFGAAGDPFTELEAMTRIGIGFNRALLAAEIAIVLGALTLLWRRASLWAASALLALVCLVTSAHVFTTTRAELHRMVESAPRLVSVPVQS